jgi:ketosteroid isomerase-like protein
VQHDDESLIRDLIKSRIAALVEKDARRAVATLGADIVSFELIGELQSSAAQVTDVEAIQAWLDAWDHLDVEVRDLQVYAGGSIGFSHGLNRLSGVRVGRAVDMWMRSTLGFRKFDDGWKIVHAHTSVPIGATAAVDLKP